MARIGNVCVPRCRLVSFHYPAAKKEAPVHSPTFGVIFPPPYGALSSRRWRSRNRRPLKEGSTAATAHSLAHLPHCLSTANLSEALPTPNSWRKRTDPRAHLMAKRTMATHHTVYDIVQLHCIRFYSGSESAFVVVLARRDWWDARCHHDL